MEEIEKHNQNKNCVCKRCSTEFVFKKNEVFWKEQGVYSEKLVKCTNCGCINVLKYVNGFNQNPNLDKRYFG